METASGGRATRAWLYVRLALVAGGLGTGLSLPASGLGAPEIGWVDWLLMLVLSAVAVVVVVGMQAVNPFSSSVWHRPSWRANPLWFGEPLQFLHLAGFTALAVGLGAAVGGLLAQNTDGWPVAWLMASSGVGILGGVRLCLRVFRHKTTRERPRVRP
jgi:hypothetical protein